MPMDNLQNANSFDLPSFPGYSVVKQIVSDDIHTVFLARCFDDGKDVLIKKYLVENVGDWKNYQQTQSEFEKLRNLNIEGVVRYYEQSFRLSESEPYYYVVEEYVGAKSIEEMIESGYLFSEGEIYEIACKILSILKELALCEQPVCHGNINPESVLIKIDSNLSDVSIILTDFAVTTQSRFDSVSGRFGYMPPEQLMGKISPESDVYSLAALIVYLLSGVQPYDMPVKDFQLVFEPSLPSVSRTVIQKLRQMLAPHIENRFCDYDELISFFSSAEQYNDAEVPNNNGYNDQNNEYIMQNEVKSTINPNNKMMDDPPSLFLTDEKKDTNTGKVIGIVIIGVIIFFIRLVLRMH